MKVPSLERILAALVHRRRNGEMVMAWNLTTPLGGIISRQH